MKTITTANATINYSLEDLSFMDMREEIPTPITAKSKSDLFRLMYDAGLEICEIAKECQAHYSFVYGVISNSREVRTVTKASVSDEIRNLYDQGLKPGEIAKQLNRNYSFVFGVVKKYKAIQELQPVEEKLVVNGTPETTPDVVESTPKNKKKKEA